MIVVSDTSSLTALLTVGAADILLKLFSEVIIPERVRDELLRGHPELPSWLRAMSLGRPRALPEKRFRRWPNVGIWPAGSISSTATIAPSLSGGEPSSTTTPPLILPVYFIMILFRCSLVLESYNTPAFVAAAITFWPQPSNPR